MHPLLYQCLGFGFVINSSDSWSVSSVFSEQARWVICATCNWLNPSLPICWAQLDFRWFHQWLVYFVFHQFTNDWLCTVFSTRNYCRLLQFIQRTFNVWNTISYRTTQGLQTEYKILPTANLELSCKHWAPQIQKPMNKDCTNTESLLYIIITNNNQPRLF